GQYYPETVEQMFDRNTRQIQEVQEATERSLRFPFGSNADGELATPVAGGVPMVNDAEDGFSWALWGTNPEALASLAMGSGATLVGYAPGVTVGQKLDRVGVSVDGAPYFASEAATPAECLSALESAQDAAIAAG